MRRRRRAASAMGARLWRQCESSAMTRDGTALDASISASRSYDAAKLKEITELFVNGGYYRARFVDVGDFDRILGSLSWAVTSCKASLDFGDVELAHDVEASLGEKIKLCESIERALRKMGCPHELRAHQVQGLDYDAVFPVARWLVARVIATRAEFGDRVRAYSRFRYGRISRMDALERGRDDEAKASGARARRALRDEYGARRRFRRAAGREPPRENPARWAKSVMMEYGHKLAGLEAFASAATAVLAASRWKRKTKASKAAGTLRPGKGASARGEHMAALVDKVNALVVSSTGGSSAVEDEEDEETGEAANELNALRDLESQLAVDDGADTLSNAVTRVILGARGGEEILAAAEKFGGEIAVSGAVGKMLAVERKISAMERTLAAETATANEARERAEKSRDELKIALDELKKVTEYNDKCATETTKLRDDLTDDEGRAAFDRVVELIKRVASSKKDEKAFKTECKKRMVELGEEIERGGEHTLDEDERTQIDDVAATHARERAKFEDERAALGKRSRAVALLSRKLEDIPTRAELIQYERRFDELFDTVQAKLKETRKYFAAHNVLADTKKYLLKEISLLDSVHRQVRPALETVNGKASLVTALESIRSGVEANVRLVEEKLSVERDAVDAAARARDDALRARRHHVALVKELRDAAARESQLRARFTERAS